VRIISKIDIKNNFVIKGINLEGLRKIGDPLEIAAKYYMDGVDEIVLIDSVASLYKRNNLFSIVKKATEKIFVPLTLGGGIRSLKDIEYALNSGADKVSINSFATENPKFIKEAVLNFGSSTITINIDAKKISEDKWEIYKYYGREKTQIDLIDWIKKIQDFGAGELIVTLVNNEGLGNGFNLSVAEKISNIIKIPFLLHGGFSNKNQILEMAKKTSASGVLISSMLHYKYIDYFKLKTKKIGNYEYLKKNYLGQNKNARNIISEIKKFLNTNKINVRL